MNIKNFLSITVFALFVGGTFATVSEANAAANIPAGCSTPGDCAELDPTLQGVILQNDLKFLDDDGTNFVGVKSPANVGADIILTLPGDTGTAGQVLSTDGSGALSWSTVSEGSSDFASLSDIDVTGVSAGAVNYFDGTSWVDLPAGTSGQSLAMNTGATAPEWVNGASGTVTDLSDTNISGAIAGNILVYDGTNSEWDNVVASGDTTLAEGGVVTIIDDAVDGTDIAVVNEAVGSVMYHDGTDWVSLDAGTSGQALVMNVGATAPEWTDTTQGVSMDVNEIVSEWKGLLDFPGAPGVTHTFAGFDIRNAEIVEFFFAEQGGQKREYSDSMQVNNGGSEILLTGVGFNNWFSQATIVSKGVGTTDILLTDYNQNFVLVGMKAYKKTTTKTVLKAGDLPISEGTGTNGQVLSSNGDGTASFTAGGGGTFNSLTDTDVAGVVAGATMYFDGTNWANLPNGTAGQSLSMNAGATAPEWVDGVATVDVKYYEFAVHRNGNGDLAVAKFIPNVEDYDPDNAFDLANGEYTAQVDGVYNFNWVAFSNFEDGPNRTGFRVNGAVKIFAGQRIGGAEDSKSNRLTADLKLNAGDKVTLEASNGFIHYFGATGHNLFTGRLVTPVQKTVVATGDLPTNDQAVSGYMDFGTMRMQWGQHLGNAGNNQNITFPAAFKTGTTPTLTATGKKSDGQTSTGIFSVSATGAGLAVVDGSGTVQSGSNAAFHWQAIGLKP